MRGRKRYQRNHKRLASDLLAALERRVDHVVSDNSLAVLQAFDAAALVGLHCGFVPGGVIKFALKDGEYESYGVHKCESLIAVASKMAHIQNSGMDFDPRLSYQYMNSIKAAVKAGIWDGLCPDWFVRQDNREL